MNIYIYMYIYICMCIYIYKYIYIYIMYHTNGFFRKMEGAPDYPTIANTLISLIGIWNV